MAEQFGPQGPRNFDLDSLREDDPLTWRNVLSLAFASKLAYQPKDVVERVTSSWGFERCLVFKRWESRAYLCEAPGIILVAFRGASSVGAWLADLDFTVSDSPYSSGNVHKDFLECYRSIRNELWSSMKSMIQSPETKLWLTGHGLGGALSTLAAIDLGATYPPHGAFTFGQPRVGTLEYARRLDLTAGLIRFVYDDDLVTRLPPGLAHGGLLVRLRDFGYESTSVREMAEAGAEVPAIREEEMVSIQEQLNPLGKPLATAESLTSATLGVDDVEGRSLLVGLQNHRLNRYVAALRRHLQFTVRVPRLMISSRQWISNRTGDKRALSYTATGQPVEVAGAPSAQNEIPVILRVAHTSWKPPDGVRVVSQIGTFVSARVAQESLPDLDSKAGVVSVEPSREAGTEELSSSIPFVGGEKIHRPPIAERGNSALIGIIDSGIDVLHETFLGATGKTRIVAIWDQTDTTGPSPREHEEALFDFEHGTLYLAADIDAMVEGSRATPKALRDVYGHGTHVASIAAGRAVGDCADGMAPEAKILVVIPDNAAKSNELQSIGYSSSHMEALDFLVKVANGSNTMLSEWLPMVINVSLGMNAGAHDGRSALEGAFDAITAKGRDPGRVIVKAAGNERKKKGHARVRAANDGVVEISWKSAKSYRSRDYLEIWYSSLDELEFTLTDPSGNSSPALSRANPRVLLTMGGNLCSLTLEELHPDNGDNLVTVKIFSEPELIQPEKWTLLLEGKSVAEGVVDVWVEHTLPQAIWLEPDDPHITITIPGTAETVICVGACVGQNPLHLVESSSHGRTRIGDPKPDICGPGQGIEAAQASFDNHKAKISKNGTSMAAPHVAGALALILSHRHKRKPEAQYNAQQLKAALKRTAQYKQSTHHEGYGWGVLDAEALFDLLK